MIRFTLRALGFVLLAGAFAALVVDGSRSIAGGRPLFTALGEVAAWLGAARLPGAVAGGPGPAREVAAAVLAIPAFLVFGAAGLALLYAGRAPAGGSGFSDRRT